MSARKFPSVGSICECYGEGGGNMWTVMEMKDGCLRMEATAGHSEYKAGYPSGWKAIRGCYQTAECKRVERAAIDPAYNKLLEARVAIDDAIRLMETKS